MNADVAQHGWHGCSRVHHVDYTAYLAFWTVPQQPVQDLPRQLDRHLPELQYQHFVEKRMSLQHHRVTSNRSNTQLQA